MIPNIIHFCWPEQTYKGSPFGLVHELAVRSAVEVNKPEAVIFHCAAEPDGAHWERVRPLLEVRQGMPDRAHGHQLRVPAHKADYWRLLAIQEGGIYLDIDTLCLRSLSPLLNSDKLVIGRQNPKTVCNAVMACAPGDPMVAMWIETFKHYRGSRWAYYAADVPTALCEHFHHLAQVEPEESFYPWSHSEMDEMFVHSLDVPERSYLLHLWASHAWQPHLRLLTPELVRETDSTYCREARRFL